MTAAVLLYFPDDTLARVDAIVSKLRQGSAGHGPTMSGAEQREANRILKAKGKDAALRYIGSLGLGTRKRRPSRTRIVAELVELGLKHYKQQA